MFVPNETVAVLFPGNEEYLFGCIGDRVQEGYEVLPFDEGPCRVPEHWIESLGEINGDDLQEALDTPAVKRVIVSLLKRMNNHQPSEIA